MAIITKDQIKKAIGLGTLNPKIINDFFYNIKLILYFIFFYLWSYI